MMGIKSKLIGFCAESLGGLEDGVSPLEMASAYATIANGGYRNRPRDDQEDRRRARARRSSCRRAGACTASRRSRTASPTRRPRSSQQNIQGGTGTHANIGCPAGGKTGTTDKNIDAWFVGFTPRLSTAVWVGFPGSTTISMNGMYAPTGGNIDGGTYPADIWGEYMKQAVGKYCGDFKQPTEPFQSQPFLGHYAREGGKDDDEGRATARTTPTRPGAAPGRRPTPGDDSPGRQRRRRQARKRRRRRTTRPSIPTPTRRRRSDRRTPDARRRHASAHRRLSAAAAPDWYNLRRQGRPAAVWWYAGRQCRQHPSRMLDPRGVLSDGYRCREVVQRREGLRLHHAR